MAKKNSRKGAKSKSKSARSRRARAAWSRWAKKKYGSVAKAKAAISRRFAASKGKRRKHSRKSEVRRLRRAEKHRFAKMSVAEKALARRARKLRRKSIVAGQKRPVSGFNPSYLDRLRAMKAELQAKAAERARAQAEYV